jgi:hypothetical protein
MGDAGYDPHVDLVRLGYDAVSERYRGDDDQPPEYAEWLQTLSARLPSHARVLDLGCGCGVPVSRELVLQRHFVLDGRSRGASKARASFAIKAQCRQEELTSET